MLDISLKFNCPYRFLRQEATLAWRFSGSALRRAATAQRLTRDLGLNAAGVALALDLLEEIETLRIRPNH